MSERFGPGAARLSGHVALLLGWPPERFWRATPEELATVLAAAMPSPDGGIDRQTINALMERERHG
ncbi:MULTISPECIES: phage tail assembly chaperone [Novosphingobium]|uniref:phage tail assembly chaperone n=1 Tax=Novosphingobium TaxID=165696 RepID=UPI001CD57A71|nr:phage tail assembly chaperone [Novosphingobium percolationis]